jgi:hypothetical protein
MGRPATVFAAVLCAALPAGRVGYPWGASPASFTA